MATVPYRSDEFGKASREALAMAGTVRLPWPSPASGPLYIGINPDSHADLPSGSPQFFIRVVQKVSPKQVITRIVDLDELRGISLPAKSAKEGTSPREFQTVNGIAREIADAKERLIAASRAHGGVCEDCLFDDAVIYVREAAPVLLRVQYEFAVSAADAAENVEQLSSGYPCCRVKDPGCEP